LSDVPPAEIPPPQRRLPLGALPIRAWFRGASPISSPCLLTWDDNGARLSISSSPDGATHPELKLDFALEVVSVHYTDPDDQHFKAGLPVITFVRRDAMPRESQQQQQQITIRFDSQDSEWSETRYGELVAWFQAHAQDCTDSDTIDVF